MEKPQRGTSMIVLGLFLLILGYYLMHQRQTKISEISDNFSITIAEIIDYGMNPGIGNGYYVKYKYKLYKTIFEKKIDCNDRFFDCDEKRDCIGKKFLLYFKKEDPNFNIIDFENEYNPCN